MRRVYIIAVVIFWLSMMCLLFQREVLPNIVILNTTGYEMRFTRDIPIRESWMGVYFKDKKIGFSNTVMLQDIYNGIPGYRINESVLLRLNMLGQERLVKIKGSSFFGEDYGLKDFNYRFFSDGYWLEIYGENKNEDFCISINTPAHKTERQLKIEKGTLVSNSISPFFLFKRLDLKKEINLRVFEPLSLTVNKVVVRDIGREILNIDGKNYETSILETDLMGIKTRSWITEDGDIIKEESSLGFVMQKEGMEKALEMGGLRSRDKLDITVQFSVMPDRPIPMPRQTSYLKVEKDHAVIEIIKDKEPDAKDVLRLPIEFMPEEDFIHSNNKRIIDLAKDIVKDEKDSWDSAKKILSWVYKNIRKTPSFGIPSSLEVLNTMQGDCNEHTVLFTALARSIGIPTKMVAGLVYLNDSFYYHAWPRVYVGTWINMDPTLGQFIADATHIPILEGGLREQMELLSVIGDSKIKILEYR